jgi:hypothetical protein
MAEEKDGDAPERKKQRKTGAKREGGDSALSRGIRNA